MTVTSIGGTDIPSPPRPLGPEGLKFWQRVWRMPCPWINQILDLEHITILCELHDERSMLRLRVLQNNDRLERVALRALDAQIIALLGALGLNPADRKAIGSAGGGEIDRESPLAKLRRENEQRSKRGAS